jgi:replicative DNA helicase
MEGKAEQVAGQAPKSSKIINLEMGKIPPQSVELEEGVLGAIMISDVALNDTIEILNKDTFYKESHQAIFEAIESLFRKNEPVDLLTVLQELRSTGKLDLAGGEYYLAQLTLRVSSAAHVEYHSRLLVQKRILRDLIRSSTQIISEAYEEGTDVFDLLDKAEQTLFEIANNQLKKNYETARELIEKAIKTIEDNSQKEGISGVPSGFKALDKVTSGWQPSDLVIIAARPGMGKTAFVLSMARNIAVEMNMPVAIFSLEMSSVQIITRLISSETEIGSEALKKGQLNSHQWQALRSKVNKLENAPLFIDDTPGISIFDLRAKCRRLVHQHGVRIIIIDYLQLMTAGGAGKNSGGNREQEISLISRSLKAIAKELSVPVLALSQLNRGVETRSTTGSKRPLLSDLRESGAIEQDADIVSFIYRPEYYKLDIWEDGTSTTNQAEIIIAKHRNGGLEDVRLKFEGMFTRFSDLDADYNYQPQAGIATFESRMNDDFNYGNHGLEDNPGF